ncbi:MAG TPA: cbb3-type cytochrome oxidase assembly protein CcoS [Rhodopila sp.]|jgi:cbb3-type cytochrome oxidase maturation protein|nr:cbb3-type cytochrome oxidase assembly protein CcoS [Rhodopila sp.]
MLNFFFLIPISIGLGLVGLAAFFWSLNDGQYADLEGAAQRILFDDYDGTHD